MSDAELLDLFGSHGGRLVFELEHSLRDHPPWHAGGFAVCADADFKLWCNFEYWSLHEATCLSIGFPPDELSDDPDPGWFHRPYPSMEFFRNRRETLRRAMGAIGLGDDRVSPKAFARWAAKVDLEVHDALLVCLRGGEKSLSPAMLSTVDGRKLGSAQKVVLGLVAEGLGSNGAVTEETMAEAAQWVKAGLDRLGLTLDPKTIKRTLSDAKSQLSRLQADQSKKDESGE